jgi:hypothetical protein
MSNETIAEALARLNGVQAKFNGRKLLNLGELKEVQDAQTALLIALAQNQT